MVAASIAAVAWSILSMKLAASSRPAAALMGTLIPLAIWAAVGPSGFGDQPILVTATGAGLVAWLFISARFAASEQPSS